MKKLIATLALAASLIAIPISTASASTSKPTDVRTTVFLKAIHHLGINGQDKPALKLAHAFCTDLKAEGAQKAFDFLLNTLEAQNASNSKTRNVGVVVGAGTAAFCPKYLPSLKAVINNDPTA
jgi:hypothetical protein